jgi:hypothetical protein
MESDFFRKYADIIAEIDQPQNNPTTQTNVKVAAGAQSLGQQLGTKGSGQMVAKGLGKVSQGQAVTGQMSQAIAPFVQPLEKILANPTLKQKFMALLKQVK